MAELSNPRGHSTPAHLTGDPAPRLSSWLLSAPGWVAVAFWVLAGVAAGPFIFHVLATDDYPRLVMSMQWARAPFLAPEDAYWLPLPYWVFGPWYAVAGKWLGLYTHLPLSGALVGLGVGLLMSTSRQLKIDKTAPATSQPLAAWICFVLPLSIPILYFIASSGLSETIYLPSLAFVMLAMTLFIGKPSRRGHLMLVAAAVVFQLSRYEGWPLSFAAVGLAHLMTWRKTSAAPRQWPGWLLTYAGLLVVPGLWMALNAHAHGNPLHFLDQAREGAGLNSALYTFGVKYRMQFLLGHAIGQGWLILALAPVGLWIGRKDRRVMALGLFAAAAWALYFQAALSNTVGVARSGRFCLGPLWMSIPLAVIGARVGLTHLKTKPAWALAVVLGLLSAVHVIGWHRSMIDKSLVDRPIYRSLLELRRSARTEALVVVIENPVTFRHPGANLFRYYLGLDAVTMLDWYDPDAPATGNFLFFPDLDNPLAGVDDVLLGKPYLELITIPPPNL